MGRIVGVEEHPLQAPVPDVSLVDQVLAWYDNEAGYAARVVDLCNILAAAARTGEDEADHQPPALTTR